MDMSTEPERDYDVIIIGCGPAGLQAAIHASRKRTSVLVAGKPENSSLYRAHIENYCCIEGVKTGKELIEAGIRQAEGFGASFVEQDVIATKAEEGRFLVTLESDKTYSALCLIICTGVSRKGLGLEREKELVGRGVSYCVDCDANFYRGADVAVVGDGSAAVHGALTLSKIASNVHLVSKEIKVDQQLMKTLKDSPVQVHAPAKVKEILGQDKVEGIVLEGPSGSEKRLDIEGLFIELGSKGAMELAAFLGVQLDPEKFTHIVTDENQATNVPGIFAAGDICGLPYQMAKAVGEGCVAGMSAGSYVQKLLREAKKK